jgi:hypothetical protein
MPSISHSDAVCTAPLNRLCMALSNGERVWNLRNTVAKLGEIDYRPISRGTPNTVHRGLFFCVSSRDAGTESPW